ncbi:hypothetical protein LPJ61_003137 [Coemansia biformis]|uniref:Uncharacterized protein n=1 Tax=Coemansia biformis TaxID=1286918 RepID=A0A9W7YEF6_9FUNG|nr:hypothetical protein LPJ61_003137 [Coemansia biformis]
MYDEMPGVEGMGARYRSPFAAFWNQGLAPGQGFPQVGMSAYGYALPGFGLGQFVSPDAQILAGAGEGVINEHDLDNIDSRVNGYDRFKDSGSGRSRPDPAYPGCFKGESCGDNDDGPSYEHRHRYHDSGAGSSSGSRRATLLWAAVASAAALAL